MLHNISWFIHSDMPQVACILALLLLAVHAYVTSPRPLPKDKGADPMGSMEGDK